MSEKPWMHWISVLFVASAQCGLAVAADPILEWNSVRKELKSLPQGAGHSSSGLNGVKEIELDRVQESVLPPIVADNSSSTRVTAVSLVGLSASIVPAVTADLVAEQKRVSISSVGSSFGKVSGLRFYRPSVGVAVGASERDYVGHRQKSR